MYILHDQYIGAVVMVRAPLFKISGDGYDIIIKVFSLLNIVFIFSKLLFC